MPIARAIQHRAGREQHVYAGAPSCRHHGHITTRCCLFARSRRRQALLTLLRRRDVRCPRRPPACPPCRHVRCRSRRHHARPFSACHAHSRAIPPREETVSRRSQPPRNTSAPRDCRRHLLPLPHPLMPAAPPSSRRSIAACLIV